MNNGFRTRPCQLPPPPRLNIHNALRSTPRTIRDPGSTSSRVPRDEHALAKRDAWTGNKRASMANASGNPCRGVDRGQGLNDSRGACTAQLPAVWPVSSMKSFGRKTTGGSRPTRFTV